MKQLLLTDINDEDIVKKNSVVLNGKQYKYLVTVLRKKVGDKLIVATPTLAGINAEIISVDTKLKELVLKINSFETNINDDDTNFPKIVLLQWLIKGSKMDTVVRQATETGVRCILPVFGEYSVITKEDNAKTERRQRIIKEARQQSGSKIDTIIFPSAKLENVLHNLEKLIGNQSSSKIMFTEKQNNNCLHKVLNTKSEVTVIAIGAEGGISRDEETLLKVNGFHSCHFRTNVLRAETAAIYAISAVQTLLTEETTWQVKE